MATELGTRIKRGRERKRWTQRRLAKELGVNVKTVDNWENGRTSPRSSIGAIEEVLGVRLDQEPEPEPEPEVPSEIIDAIDLAYPGDDNAALRKALVEAFRQQVRSGTSTTAAGAAAGPGRHRRAV